MGGWITLIIVLTVLLLAAAVVAYFFGRRYEKKSLQDVMSYEVKSLIRQEREENRQKKAKFDATLEQAQQTKVVLDRGTKFIPPEQT